MQSIECANEAALGTQHFLDSCWTERSLRVAEGQSQGELVERKSYHLVILDIKENKLKRKWGESILGILFEWLSFCVVFENLVILVDFNFK